MRKLAGPVVRHLAVGTGAAHARAIGVLDGGLKFLECLVLHLVAASAERFRIGRLQRRIEAAPEDYARHEAEAELRLGSRSVLHYAPRHQP